MGDNITIAGLNFTGDDPNGTFPLSSVNFNTRTIQYADSGTDEVFTTVGASQRWSTIQENYSNMNQVWSSLNPSGTTSVASMGNSIATTLNFTLNDGAVNAVYGSAVFSDATSENDDFVFSALITFVSL